MSIAQRLKVHFQALAEAAATDYQNDPQGFAALLRKYAAEAETALQAEEKSLRDQLAAATKVAAQAKDVASASDKHSTQIYNKYSALFSYVTDALDAMPGTAVDQIVSDLPVMPIRVSHTTKIAAKAQDLAAQIQAALQDLADARRDVTNTLAIAKRLERIR